MIRASFAAAALTAIVPAALAVPTAASPAPVERAVEAAARASITARTDLTTIDAGYDVQVRGRVTPGGVGQQLVLQQRLVEQRRWRDVGEGRTRRNGAYVLTHRPDRGGEYRYRVVKPRAAGVPRAVSNVVEVDVWASEALPFRSPGAMAGVDFGGVRVGDVPRHPSIVLVAPGTSGYVEYTLGRKCDTLSSEYALTDRSEWGATGTVTVTVDGRVAATYSLATGTLAARETIDVTDAFRVRFDLQGSVGPSGSAAVIQPWVHCAP